MNDLIIKQNDIVQVSQEAIEKIKTLKKAQKNLKEAEDELNKTLLEQMEKFGVDQIKNDTFTISYTPEHTAVRFDSKALKEQSPALYDSYCKETTVKSSIRITLKKEKA